jgi:hypothetical protein
MKKSCVVIGNANHIKFTDTKAWKDFIDSLNNPPQETVDNRKKFFEECDKLFITREDDFIHVESDKLDTEEILRALSK